MALPNEVYLPEVYLDGWEFLEHTANRKLFHHSVAIAMAAVRRRKLDTFLTALTALTAIPLPQRFRSMCSRSVVRLL